MKVIVDRFEGEYAVVEMENMEMCDMPRILIPNAKEGDVIEIKISVDDVNERKEQIDALANKLFK